MVQRHPRDDDGKPDPGSTVRSLRVMRWGFVPHWAKDKSIGNRMINARAETVAETDLRQFRPHFRRKSFGDGPGIASECLA